MLTLALATALAAASQARVEYEPSGSNLKTEYVERVDSADVYLKAQRWDDASRCLTDAMRIDPANFQNSLLFNNLGIAQMHSGLFDEAVQSFSTGLSLAPASSTLRYNRARAYLGLNRPDFAADDLSAIIDRDPANSEARALRGILLMYTGNPEYAIADLENVAEPDADTLSALATCYQDVGDQRAALATLDRLVNMQPDDQSYASRAAYHALNGNFEQASQDVADGMRINDRNGDLYLIRAYINTVMHQNSDAEINKKLAREYGADNQLFLKFFPEPPKKK